MVRPPTLQLDLVRTVEIHRTGMGEEDQVTLHILNGDGEYIAIVELTGSVLPIRIERNEYDPLPVTVPS
jgi:hypothetical protein